MPKEQRMQMQKITAQVFRRRSHFLHANWLKPLELQTMNDHSRTEIKKGEGSKMREEGGGGGERERKGNAGGRSRRRGRFVVAREIDLNTSIDRNLASFQKFRCRSIFLDSRLTSSFSDFFIRVNDASDE